MPISEKDWHLFWFLIDFWQKIRYDLEKEMKNHRQEGSDDLVSSQVLQKTIDELKAGHEANAEAIDDLATNMKEA